MQVLQPSIEAELQSGGWEEFAAELDWRVAYAKEELKALLQSYDQWCAAKKTIGQSADHVQ